MSDFVAASQAKPINDTSWLADINRAGASVWREFSFPSRKTEDWKYTNLSALAKRDFFSNTPKTTEIKSLSLIQDTDATRIVFINGVFDSALSSIEEQTGLNVVRFAEANAEQQKMINAHLNSVVELDKHGFSALNAQCIDDGVFIHINKDAVLDKPIYLVNHLASEDDDIAVNPRVLIVAEQGASAKVLEHFSSQPESQACFSNAVVELIAEENAQLGYYQLLEQEEHCQHIGGVHAKLERNAKLDSFFLSFGTLLTRVDITVTYAGEGAEAEINGVYLPQGKQHVDFHTCVEHAVPHCQTNEVFRGIIADEARAVFNGRIHIHPDAQKTEAYLSNKNLLTSNRAEVDTKPELEIYADDVRCAHGATVSQLEPNAIHYLKTRGISEEEALVMLSFGFINELLENIRFEKLSDYCRPKLAARFARDPSLMRHLL